MQDYSQRLRAARERLGVSLAEMAAALMTPTHLYAQWERGTRHAPGVAVAAAEMITKRKIKLSKRKQTSLSRKAPMRQPYAFDIDYEIANPREGETWAAMAKRLNISAWTLMKARHKRGITGRRTSLPTCDASEKDPRRPTASLVMELARIGKSRSEIALELGVSRQRVHQIIHAAKTK